VGPHGSLRLNLLLDKPAPGAIARAGWVASATIVALALLASPVKLCLVATLLHVPCPGCGLTRAAFAMARGDVARAFAFHPLAIVLVPVVLFIAGAQALDFVRTGSAWSRGGRGRWTEVLLAALAVLLVVVWVARLCGAFGGPVAV
jgi:hypothetical protein